MSENKFEETLVSWVRKLFVVKIFIIYIQFYKTNYLFFKNHFIISGELFRYITAN